MANSVVSDKLSEFSPLLFRLAADSAPDGIAIVDLDGCIIYVNEARACMHGYSREELIGKNVLSLSESPSVPGHSVEDVMRSGRWEGEAFGTRKDGSRFPMRQTITRVDDIDGTPIALLSVTSDITQEREAQRKVVEAQQQYRNLVENAIVGVYRNTADGRILYFNDAAARTFGFKNKEEATKHNMLEYYYNRERREELLDLLKKQGQVAGFEVRIRTISGEAKTLLLSATLDGDIVSGVFIDITDKKKYEESLRRSSQQLLELLNASRELNSSLDTGSVLRSLVQHAMALISATGGAAGLYSDDRMIFQEYHQGNTIIPVDYLFRAGYGIPGWVIEHKVPYMANDAEHDPQVIPHIVKELGISKLVDVPIISKDGRLLGCFELHRGSEGAPFADEDVVLLAGFANQAAVALSNAALAEDLMRTGEELQRNEETLRLVVEGTPDFFFYVQDTEGMFTYVSPSIVEMTGHSIEEWKSHYTRFLTDNPINEQAIRNTERVMNTGEAVPPYPVEVYVKDGSRILLEVYERPILRDGEVIGLHGVARNVTELRRSEASREAIRQESEESRRRFYRETILSVTDGKLSICDPEDMEELCNDPLFPSVEIREPQDVAMARDEVRRAALKSGMAPDQAENLVLCVGEAATNALKHAGGGTICVSDIDNALRVEVADTGSGMDSLALPRLTLMRGFSTTKSLGMGYATMLALADKVYLSTNPQGTRVLIEVSKQPKEPGVELQKLPDLW